MSVTPSKPGWSASIGISSVVPRNLSTEGMHMLQKLMEVTPTYISSGGTGYDLSLDFGRYI